MCTWNTNFSSQLLLEKKISIEFHVYVITQIVARAWPATWIGVRSI